MQALFDMLLAYLPFLLLAASGGIIAERAGISALCLEGLSVCGAVGAALSLYLLKNQPIYLAWSATLFFATITGAVTAAIYAVIVIKFKFDAVVSSLIVNFVSVPIAVVILKATIHKSQMESIEPRIPRLLFVFMAISMFIITWLLFSNSLKKEKNKNIESSTPIRIEKEIENKPVEVLFQKICLLIWLFRNYISRHGSHLIACGEEQREAYAAGLSVGLLRFFAMIVCGSACGLAGAYLSVSFTNVFHKGLVGGRGYLAVAAIILGGWRPTMILIWCALLALLAGPLVDKAESLQIMPQQFAKMLPYLIGLIVLLGKSQRDGIMPRELMKPSPLANIFRPLRIGFILATGKKNDRSVNEYLVRSWHNIGKQFRIIPSPPMHPGMSLSTAERYVKELSRDHSHIVGIGSFMLAPFLNASSSVREWPRLAIIDGEGDHSHVECLNFKEDHASKIAGYLAAKIASIQDSSVAFLGGCKTPSVQRWENGFCDGVIAFNRETMFTRDVKCHVDYVGESHTAFSYGARAYRLAEYYIERQDAAIIMQVCGAAGRNVIDKAKSIVCKGNSNFIGLICSDYDKWKPDDPVLFSLIRRLDQIVHEWIQRGSCLGLSNAMCNVGNITEGKYDKYTVREIVSIGTTMVDAVCGPAWETRIKKKTGFGDFCGIIKDTQNKIFG